MKVSNKVKSNKYSKNNSLGKLYALVIVIALNILFFPTLTMYTLQGNNRFTIKLGDNIVGVTDSADNVFELYREARRELAAGSDKMVFMDYNTLSYEGEEVVYGDIDSDRYIIDNMKSILSAGTVETMAHSYSIKVNNDLVSVASAEEVKGIFQTAVNKYDPSGSFGVDLVMDANRELSVLTPVIRKEENSNSVNVRFDAGFDGSLDFTDDDVVQNAGTGFDAYEYGIESMEFSDEVEIVEAYVPARDIIGMSLAENLLLEEQETQQIYTVVSGDTLSGISIKVGLPLDEIIALNDSIENEHSTIRIDQELVITVPEPSLSILWTEQAKLEEAYNLPIEYTYNDDWYTSDSVTHQQPSAGYHEAVLLITHDNENVIEKETLYEEVIVEAIPKQVEVGTIIPPTYIKPLSGGMMSSGFGYRRSPGGFGSSNHKGIDWATPIGTSVYASCGGVVEKAGWSGGYGYCVLIRHPDGKETRYAHCSRLFVSAGQTVNQGQVIAASGNTGASTGPHLHFEIIVNGVQVNPLNYL